MAQAFANPTVRINDITISIVPNTVKTMSGDGETNVRAASAGGNSIITVHTSNAESKIGSCEFSVYPTPELERSFRGWKDNIGGNVISLIEVFADGSTSSETFETASLVNDPEKEKSSDGVVALEFKGNPSGLG
jgi:hypothetical protein